MFRDFDQSTKHETSSVISSAQNKEYFKKNKLSGVFKEYDPITGELIQEGEFLHGKEVGLWKVIDEDGDQQHFQYREERIGARCRDGSFSSATGRGACSWHGGVSEWIVQNQRYPVGGTGKYEPIQKRVLRTKQKLRDQLKINVNKSDQQLMVELGQRLLKLQAKSEEKKQEDEQDLVVQLAQMKEQYESRIQQLQQIQAIIESENEQVKVEKKNLQEKLASQTKNMAEKEKAYQEIIRKMKLKYEQQLSLLEQQIHETTKELEESRQNQQHLKRKLESQTKNKKLSQSKPKKKNASLKKQAENQQIQAQIKKIQQQLNLLNQTIIQKQAKNNSSEQDSSDQQSSVSQRSLDKKKSDDFIKVEEKKELKIENYIKDSTQTHQQSSIAYVKCEEPSRNDSLSYSKILNSKLFKDDNNKSDLSCFVDCKEEKKQEKKQKQQEKVQKGNQSSNEQRRKFQFKPQSSSEQQNNQITLKTDSQDNEDEEQDNKDIFKSIPFKPSGVQQKLDS